MLQNANYLTQTDSQLMTGFSEPSSFKTQREARNAVLLHAFKNGIDVSNSSSKGLMNLIGNIIELNSQACKGTLEDIFPTIPSQVIENLKLRSNVYTPLGYNEQFPEEISGLNFDDFDNNSLLIHYKRDNQTTGSLRIILDKGLLPSESDTTHPILEKWRAQGLVLAELSRLVVDKEFQKQGIEFKNLLASSYVTGKRFGIDKYIMGVSTKHYENYYSKFGGIDVIEQMKSYGNIQNQSVVLSWDLDKISKLFQRGFLKGKKLSQPKMFFSNA